jgi:hypothetical protein
MLNNNDIVVKAFLDQSVGAPKQSIIPSHLIRRSINNCRGHGVPIGLLDVLNYSVDYSKT